MTIMGIAGHVSREMLQHYSHISLEAKRKALDGLEIMKRPAILTRPLNHSRPKGPIEGV